MSDHDPLCRFQGTPSHGECDCPLIAKARADERENGEWVRPYRDALMRALRTKVEALPIAHHYGGERGWCVRIADVLDLLDGAGR